MTNYQKVKGKIIGVGKRSYSLSDLYISFEADDGNLFLIGYPFKNDDMKQTLYSPLEERLEESPDRLKAEVTFNEKDDNEKIYYEGKGIRFLK